MLNPTTALKNQGMFTRAESIVGAGSGVVSSVQKPAVEKAAEESNIPKPLFKTRQ